MLCFMQKMLQNYYANMRCKNSHIAVVLDH